MIDDPVPSKFDDGWGNPMTKKSVDSIRVVSKNVGSILVIPGNEKEFHIKD